MAGSGMGGSTSQKCTSNSYRMNESEEKRKKRNGLMTDTENVTERMKTQRLRGKMQPWDGVKGHKLTR